VNEAISGIGERDGGFSNYVIIPPVPASYQ
jgi:alcohol dehydrogenase